MSLEAVAITRMRTISEVVVWDLTGVRSVA
jgi:hypothetical protein